MTKEFITAFFFVFLAEMGDKTQLLAMVFATKYKIKEVLFGIFIGSFLNHFLAILIGLFLSNFIDLQVLGIIAGFAFLGFGIWSLQVSDDITKTKSKYGPVVTVSLAFFLGELGDKTQLTAITLATEANYPAFILLGTVSAMVMAGVLGIYIGIKLGSRVPDFYIKTLTSLLFITFGLVKVLSNGLLDYFELYYFYGFIGLLGGLYVFMFKGLYKDHTDKAFNAYQSVAQELQDQYKKIEYRMEGICLGLKSCNVCHKDQCLIGYTKDIIRKATKQEAISIKSLNRTFVERKFETKKVELSLREVIDFLTEHPNDISVNEVRKALEKILFNTYISKFKSKEAYIEKLMKLDSELAIFLSI